MQPIQGFEQVQAVHGRSDGILPGGAYVMQIVRAKEDTTGYGNQCLKLVYEVAEGDYVAKFASIDADPEQDWRHEVEVDVEEASGARLKALVDAVMASNPGYVWDWNEQGLAGKYVGLVLQERKVTLTRGKNKGRDRTYLDLWDCVAIDAVRAGQVPTPPVNDKRTSKGDAKAQVPAGYAQQPAPVAAPQPVQQPMAPVAQPMAQPTQQQYAPQAQVPPAQGYAQQPMAQPMQQPMAPMPDVYDQDIPF